MTDYAFKGTPLAHQAEAFYRNRDKAAWLLFWDQGTGKTFPTLNEFCYRCERGDVDTLLVVAPKGVHLNWSRIEIMKWLPDRLRERCMIVEWHAQKAARGEKYRERLNQSLKYNGPLIVCLNYESSFSDTGGLYIAHLRKKRKMMMVLDEAHFVKGSLTKRRRRLEAVARSCPVRRGLTGTPITNKPADIYYVVKTVDEGFWASHGFGSYAAFKAHFVVEDYWGNPIGVQHVEELRGLLALCSDRRLKSEVLDLPPKYYSTRLFELAPEQRRVYDTLNAEDEVTLESGSEIDTPLAMVKALRLRQITRGYVAVEKGQPVERICKQNPSLDALGDDLSQLSTPAIICACFTADIDALCALLGSRAVRYDGKVSDIDGVQAIADFQAGKKQFFVYNPQKGGGTGITLTAAESMFYYSCSFRLDHRSQSEDRAHRIGQNKSLHIVDYVAVNTIDEGVVASLQGKKEMAADILGDNLR